MKSQVFSRFLPLLLAKARLCTAAAVPPSSRRRRVSGVVFPMVFLRFLKVSSFPGSQSAFVYGRRRPAVVRPPSGARRGFSSWFLPLLVAKAPLCTTPNITYQGKLTDPKSVDGPIGPQLVGGQTVGPRSVSLNEALK